MFGTRVANRWTMCSFAPSSKQTAHAAPHPKPTQTKHGNPGPRKTNGKCLIGICRDLGSSDDGPLIRSLLGSYHKLALGGKYFLAWSKSMFTLTTPPLPAAVSGSCGGTPACPPITAALKACPSAFLEAAASNAPGVFHAMMCRFVSQ